MEVPGDRSQPLRSVLWLEVQGGQSTLSFALLMVWHNSMTLGNAIEEREVGIWVEIDIVVKI